MLEDYRLKRVFMSLLKHLHYFKKIFLVSYFILLVTEIKKKKLINLIRNKKLSSKIKLIDWKNDLSQFYKNSSIFILPSYFEGFGNVLIEALNFCLPCISTKNDGPNQILKNGKYGLLIKDNKPTSINTSLIEVIENYKFYKLKSIAGFKDIKKYHIDFIGDQYLKKIKSVLKNK